MAKPFNRVLIPIDGSRYSMHAAEYGIKLAKAYEMEALALYVIDEAVIESLGQVADEKPDALHRKLKREGENCLSYLAGLAKQEGVHLDQLIEQGTPYRAIVNLAKKQGVDLIVIGKVGQRGPRRIIIGSVTERVIENASCPVLVVRPE